MFSVNYFCRFRQLFLPVHPLFLTALLGHINDFFFTWTKYLLPKLRPGANVIIASHPLLNQIVSTAATRAGLEKRGEIIRLVMTMRGGDRPKGAHQEFTDVTVMPRSMWEPWIVLRKPSEGTIQENLRRWGTGGFKRPSENSPLDADFLVRKRPGMSNLHRLYPINS